MVFVRGKHVRRLRKDIGGESAQRKCVEGALKGLVEITAGHVWLKTRMVNDTYGNALSA